jgi:hypothetical protein
MLAAIYAVFLLLAAVGLDRLARHTQHRSHRVRTAGFRFHARLDAWECPRGEYLWPILHDRERRLVRYRARALVCNSCSAKEHCTASDEGREIVRYMEPWPQSEAGRFHRVISIVLVVLATVIAAAALTSARDVVDVLVLGSIISVSTLLALHLVAGLREDRQIA